MKVLLIVLGFLSALLIVIQMVMGVLMRNGQANTALRTAHFHSGSLMVLVSLAYIALSLAIDRQQARSDRGAVEIDGQSACRQAAQSTLTSGLTIPSWSNWPKTSLALVWKPRNERSAGRARLR